MTVRTVLGVFAHPDDECTSAGGVLARCADAGIRVVLVSCTNGEFGDDVKGTKPGTAGHDRRRVAETRSRELDAACRRLGVSAVERLGYHDSGMPGWAKWADTTVFSAVPAAEVAERVRVLIAQYRPEVVLTHNPDAGHEHVDHRHAGRATALAVPAETTLYFGAHGAKRAEQLRKALGRNEIEPERRTSLELIEQRITNRVELGSYVQRKRRALFEHESQLASSAAAQLTPEQYEEVFGTETFIRAQGDIGLASAWLS
jgi:LmbE family N-acetylglucosaminyl deacetylase